MTGTLTITADLVTSAGARFGVDDVYPELVWLPVVGPSTFLLWRHLATRVADASADRIVLDAETMARSLGLSSQRGEQSALGRALRRAERFRLLRRPHPELVLVQLQLPPVGTGSLTRQHAHVVAAHHRLLDGICTGATAPPR